MDTRQPGEPKGWLSSRNGPVLIAFLAIAAFFLITEHRAHLFGALPYLLLLACPLLHLFHGHGGHGGHENRNAGSSDTSTHQHDGGH